MVRALAAPEISDKLETKVGNKVVWCMQWRSCRDPLSTCERGTATDMMRLMTTVGVALAASGGVSATHPDLEFISFGDVKQKLVSSCFRMSFLVGPCCIAGALMA